MSDGLETPDELWRKLELMAPDSLMVHMAFQIMSHHQMTREHFALMLAVTALNCNEKLGELLREERKRKTEVIFVKGDPDDRR